MHNARNQNGIRLMLSLAMVALAGWVHAQAPADATASSTPTQRGVLDVKDFGAIGDGKADDTEALQRVIDRARLSGESVYLPPGHYTVRTLNLTFGGMGFIMRGAGPAASVLVARENSNCVIDLSGAYYMKLQDFMIRTGPGEIVPKTGIYMGQPKSWSGNLISLDNVHIVGRYSVAAFYCHCVCSSSMTRCTFNNSQQGDVAVVAFTMFNYAGMRSEFMDTLPVEAGNCSDWTLNACEIHHFAVAKDTPSSATAVVLENTMQMRWFGGNVSSEGPQIFKLMKNNRNLTISGATLYTEMASLAGVVFRNYGQLRSAFIGEGFLQASDAIFAGEGEVEFDEITFHSKPTIASPGSVKLFDAPQGTVRNSLLHCDGLSMRVGEISDSMLINPGAIEGKTARLLSTAGQ